MNSAGIENGELLIVEDDRDFIEDLFTMWSSPLPVARASSGEEAVEYLRTNVPALVLLDLNLPHCLARDDADEGLEILSYIKNQVGSDVPVIVVTRESSQEMRSAAASLGARDFLPKPLDVSGLENAVWSVLRERRDSSS
ncbi:MAG: response regulator [Candidatus Krumholzibacteria bacterium]|nr:response regulator [Candidatus Krumholzibacteria bacterium]